MNKIIVLTDIHANLSALQAVITHFSTYYQVDGIALLGDIIDYGMRPNEVIEIIQTFNHPIICNLTGNHEQAIFNDHHLGRFSSDRGRFSLNYTKNILTQDSLLYLTKMNQEGKMELNLNGKKILFIHGDIEDPYWGKLTIDKTNDLRYSEYDYVISGHTHIPLYFEKISLYEKGSIQDRRKTIFLNPGSVGQPRNLNPRAQYLYIDITSQIIHHNSVSYDIETERGLYPTLIDPYYKDRLLKGI